MNFVQCKATTAESEQSDADFAFQMEDVFMMEDVPPKLGPDRNGAGAIF